MGMALAMTSICIINVKHVASMKKLTSADRMRFAQWSEGLFGVEVSSAHFLLVRKRREKQVRRGLAGQREVG
jgi:histidinol-phosphate/aromatic aminotransferase/cobyric acid decarboxylase-like protein